MVSFIVQENSVPKRICVSHPLKIISHLSAICLNFYASRSLFPAPCLRNRHRKKIIPREDGSALLQSKLFVVNYFLHWLDVEETQNVLAYRKLILIQLGSNPG